MSAAVQKVPDDISAPDVMRLRASLQPLYPIQLCQGTITSSPSGPMRHGPVTGSFRYAVDTL